MAIGSAGGHAIDANATAAPSPFAMRHIACWWKALYVFKEKWDHPPRVSSVLLRLGLKLRESHKS